MLSGSTDLEHLHTFADFPVFMGCLEQPATADLKHDMSWWISRDTGIIQLQKLLPLEVIYPASHSSGLVGTMWQTHHRAFANFVHKTNPKAVFEIGGAHGILCREYQELAQIDWTIIEPNPTPVAGCRATYIKGFFDNTFKHSGYFDTVVHSHVFEHVYDPDQFMATLANFMQDGQKLVFSLPNLQAMFERKYNNCINFEHTVLLTEPYIDYLLAKYGFFVHKKEYFMEDHSIFYFAVRKAGVPAKALSHDLYVKNKNLYLDYLKYYEKVIYDLNKAIKEIDNPIYLFGAHIFAQYLIAFGLDTSKIVCLLDNDVNKQGKRLYGTNFLVQSPTCLRDIANPTVILKAGVYNKEIKMDILENINNGVIFLE